MTPHKSKRKWIAGVVFIGLVCVVIVTMSSKGKSQIDLQNAQIVPKEQRAARNLKKYAIEGSNEVDFNSNGVSFKILKSVLLTLCPALRQDNPTSCTLLVDPRSSSKI